MLNTLDFDVNYIDGITIKTVDSNIDINSGRDINIIADSTPKTGTMHTSVKNINILAVDTSATTTLGYSDPNKLLLSNSYEDVISEIGFIEISSTTKTSSKFIKIISRHNESSINSDCGISIDYSVGIKLILPNSTYFTINTTQSINEISSNITLGDFGSSDYILPTQKAVKSYIDNKIIESDSVLEAHITTNGINPNPHPHPLYLNQSVTTTSSPTFYRVKLDNGNSYIDTSNTNSFILKTGSNNLNLITHSSGDLTINNEDLGSGYNIPSKIIFKNGTVNYVDIEIGKLTLNNNIDTKGYYINNGSVNSIKIDTLGNVAIKGDIATNYSLTVTGDIKVTDNITIDNLTLNNENNKLYQIDDIFTLKINESKLYLTGNDEADTIIINNSSLTDLTIPQNYIWNSGSDNSYANFKIGSLNVNGNITTNTNWISNNGDSNSGIYINEFGNVGINETGNNTYDLQTNTLNITGNLTTNIATVTTLTGTGISNFNIVNIGSTLTTGTLSVVGVVEIIGTLKLTNSISKISTDGLFSDNSDSSLVTEKAINTRINNLITTHTTYAHKNLIAGNGIILTGNYNGSADRTISANFENSSADFGSGNYIARSDHKHSIYALCTTNGQDTIDKARKVYDDVDSSWKNASDVKISKLWIGNSGYIFASNSNTFDGARWTLASNSANSFCYVKSAENSNTLRGYAPSIVASANSIVLRNSAGYIETGYLKMSANVETINPTYLVGTWGSDNYLRYVNRDNLIIGTANNVVNKGDVSSILSDFVVSKYIRWNYFGNGGVIFDASKGLAPNGSATNKTNSTAYWIENSPTLMGWNGSSTVGIRVDSSRRSDSSATADTATTANNSLKLNDKIFNWDSVISSNGNTWILGGGDGFSSSGIVNRLLISDLNVAYAVKSDNATKTFGSGDPELVQHYSYTETTTQSGVNTFYKKSIYNTYAGIVRFVGWFRWDDWNYNIPGSSGVAHYTFLNLTLEEGYHFITATLVDSVNIANQAVMFYELNTDKNGAPCGINIGFYRGSNIIGTITWRFSGTIYIIN